MRDRYAPWRALVKWTRVTEKQLEMIDSSTRIGRAHVLLER
jgi:hypothetical protein